MKNLTSVRKIIDDALDDFETGNTHNELKRILCVLSRLRPNYETYFKDFYSYIEKLSSYDPEYSFYSDLRSYLKKTFRRDPWDAIYSYLNNKGFSKEHVSSMIFSNFEQKFMFSLPSKRNFLYILIFYLYNPQKTQTFFMCNMSVPLSEEEQTILTYFRKLNEDLRPRAISYVKYLSKYDYR